MKRRPEDHRGLLFGDPNSNYGYCIRHRSRRPHVSDEACIWLYLPLQWAVWRGGSDNMTWVRHLVSLLTIGCYLLATVNVPLPALSALEDSDFPCRNHGCGCLDAVMCRTRCCCIKPVRPVVKCCKKGKKELAGCPLPVGQSLVAASTSSKSVQDAQSRPPRPAQRTGGWIMGTMKCQGAMPTFAAVGPVAPIEPEVRPHLEPKCHGGVAVVVALLTPQDSLDPSAPPPRPLCL